ncbi:MAG: Hpt domain-containing protein [Lentimicrobium sp.]|nr:Hpt domain-containing protein [Lentimicrobium sp.]
MVDKKLFHDAYQYLEKSVIVEIIDIFFEEFPGRLLNLKNNVNEADFVKLRFNAHSLKGVVSSFAAAQVYEKARNLEKKATELIENRGENFNKEELISTLAEIEKMIFEMAEDLKLLKTDYQ